MPVELVLVLLLIFLWFRNIYLLFKAKIPGEAILRTIAIFLVPLGILMGLFPNGKVEKS